MNQNCMFMYHSVTVKGFVLASENKSAHKLGMFKTGNDLSLQQGAFHTLFSGIFSRKTACRSSASGMPKQKQRNREMRDFSRLMINIPQ